MASLVAAHEDAVTIDYGNLQVPEVDGAGQWVGDPPTDHGRLGVTPDDVRGGVLVQQHVFSSMEAVPDVRQVGDDEPVELTLPWMHR